jgi:hypothetical protein
MSPYNELRTGMTQGMFGEHGVPAGKSEKKTFDRNVHGCIILSSTIMKYAR